MSDTEDFPPDEQIHANAVQFLLDGHEEHAASILLACIVRIPPLMNNNWGDYEVTVQMAGPREAYEALNDNHNPIHNQIANAFNAVLPLGYVVGGIHVRVASAPVSPDWRKELLEIASGKNVHNQGMVSDEVKAITWQGLRFCSESERRIAAALDMLGVMYLANCKARLGVADHRTNRIPDFLICHEGKWGVLEVDGEPFHPPSRKAQEDEKDRLLKAHGILVVEHFDATQCYQTPQKVVKTFLDILKRS